MPDIEAALQKFVTIPNQSIELGLGRIERLLEQLGNPQNQLPPIIHVAGTNGKGSTIAFMRAMLEAAGLRVHVFTSPHLVHFNERIRLAGRLVSDAELLTTFEEVAKVNNGAPISYFEMKTVTAFILFARVPADVVLLEVGLGGRLDATNVVMPAVSVITRISYDHVNLLGDTLEKIAVEKAGIMKPGAPCIMAYQADDAVKQTLRVRAAEVGCELIEYGEDFTTQELPDSFVYRVDQQTSRPVDQKFPSPALLGAHQILNAATAITALRTFSSLIPHPFSLSEENIRAGLRNVEWPGRLQRITTGPLAAMLPPGAELWYDGAHNDSGAEALAEQCRRWRAAGYEIHLVLGMLRTKDPKVFNSILDLANTIATIPIAKEHSGFQAAELAQELRKTSSKTIKPFSLLKDKIKQLGSGKNLILLTGSLYLAPKTMAAITGISE